MKKPNPPQIKDAIFISSVIGNLLQAIGQAEKAKNLQTAQNALSRVTAEREYLKSQLRLWITDNAKLKNHALQLEKEMSELRKMTEALSQQIYSLKRQQNENDSMIVKLKKENEELRKDNKK
ncbi:hypothetical protein HY768_10835 [candidate division TA06 bacterium]|uniref:Uncharacterized protein n=1 Tax=candidate division TA06 bacterium TaxID=2250710 RepID=A0A933ICX8_UNCT6|nr:hypothetical protein [candidate division TA06 bacterium]